MNFPVLGNAYPRGAAVAAEGRFVVVPDISASRVTRGWLLDFNGSSRLIPQLRTPGFLIHRRPEHNTQAQRRFPGKAKREIPHFRGMIRRYSYGCGGFTECSQKFIAAMQKSGGR